MEGIAIIFIVLLVGGLFGAVFVDPIMEDPRPRPSLRNRIQLRRKLLRGKYTLNPRARTIGRWAI